MLLTCCLISARTVLVSSWHCLRRMIASSILVGPGFASTLPADKSRSARHKDSHKLEALGQSARVKPPRCKKAINMMAPRHTALRECADVCTVSTHIDTHGTVEKAHVVGFTASYNVNAASAVKVK